jgi:hypothetical protein
LLLKNPLAKLGFYLCLLGLLSFLSRFNKPHKNSDTYNVHNLQGYRALILYIFCTITLLFLRFPSNLLAFPATKALKTHNFTWGKKVLTTPHFGFTLPP